MPSSSSSSRRRSRSSRQHQRARRPTYRSQLISQIIRPSAFLLLSPNSPITHTNDVSISSSKNQNNLIIDHWPTARDSSFPTSGDVADDIGQLDESTIVSQLPTCLDNYSDPENNSNDDEYVQDDDDDIMGESELIFIGGGDDDDNDNNDEEVENVDHNCVFEYRRPPSPVPRQLLASEAAARSSLEPIELLSENQNDEGRNFETLVDEIDRELDDDDDEEEDDEKEKKERSASESGFTVGCTCPVKCECLCHYLVRRGELVNRHSSTNSSTSLGGGRCRSGSASARGSSRAISNNRLQRHRGHLRCCSSPARSLEWDVSVDLATNHDDYNDDTFENENENSTEKSKSIMRVMISVLCVERECLN